MQTLKAMADEKVRDARWEYWLHRVSDMSFEDYEKHCKRSQQTENGMSHNEIGKVINDSKKMLEGFVPE